MVFMILSITFLTDANLQKNQELARDSVQKLATAADSVYAQGEGSTIIVEINLPINTVFDTTKTYIGKPSNAPFSTESKTINVRVQNNDIFAPTRAQLQGAFPAYYGLHLMRVYSAGSYVVISPHLSRIDRNSIFISMARGETRNETLQMRKLVSQSVTATAASSWAFEEVSVSVTPSSMPLEPYDKPITFTITADADSSGLYNSELRIAAQDSNGETESFIVPLTVDIR